MAGPSSQNTPSQETEKSLADLQAELAETRSRVQDLEKEIETYRTERSFFNTLMNNLPDRIYFKDRESRFTRVNSALASMHGLENPETAIGLSDADFFTEEHAQQARADEQEILESRRPVVGLVEKETWADGRETFVTTTKMPLVDENNSVIGTFGVSRDITELKRAQAALSDSEALYHSLVENLAQGICRKDRDGRFTYCNRQFCEILGKPEKELIGKSAFDLFPEEEARQLDEDDRRVMESGQEYEALDEFSTPDGRTLFLQVVKSPLRDAEGNVVGVQGVFWDVTQKQRAEEATILLAAIVHSSDDAIIGTDLTGKILSWNQGAERVYGYPPKEIVGLNIESLIPSQQLYELEAILEQISQGESFSHYETKHRTQSGDIIDVSLNASPIINSEGEIVGIAVIARDITKRKQAEAAVYQLGAIVESSSEPIIGLTLDSTIVSWNPAAERIYGYSAEQVEGKPVTLLSPEDRKGDVFEVFGKAIRGERLDHHETFHVTQSGERLPVSLTLSPIVHAGADKVTGVSIIVRVLEEQPG